MRRGYSRSRRRPVATNRRYMTSDKVTAGCFAGMVGDTEWWLSGLRPFLTRDTGNRIGGSNPSPLRPIAAVAPEKKEGIMEPKREPQTKDDARAERGEVKLDRRYGEIGISAVAAAVQCQGKRLEEPTSILAPPWNPTKE